MKEKEDMEIIQTFEEFKGDIEQVYEGALYGKTFKEYDGDYWLWFFIADREFMLLPKGADPVRDSNKQINIADFIENNKAREVTLDNISYIKKLDLAFDEERSKARELFYDRMESEDNFRIVKTSRGMAIKYGP